MLKLNRNKIRIRFKNYRIGEYFRQFSIVVGGIIVTFWGSTLITEMPVRKKYKRQCDY